MIQSFFNVDESYIFKTEETRDLMRELQDELNVLNRDCDNSMCFVFCHIIPDALKPCAFLEQQVIDLLRTRLETTTGELLEQKDRSVALETQQAKNAEELRDLAAAVGRSGDTLHSVSVGMELVHL